MGIACGGPPTFRAKSACDDKRRRHIHSGLAGFDHAGAELELRFAVAVEGILKFSNGGLRGALADRAKVTDHGAAVGGAALFTTMLHSALSAPFSFFISSHTTP